MRSVVSTLEDLQHTYIQNVTFAFKRLGTHPVPKEAVNILPFVIAKMKEHLGSKVVVKAKWLDLKNSIHSLP